MNGIDFQNSPAPDGRSAALSTGVPSPAATLVVERLFLSTGHNFVGHHGGPAGTQPTVEVNALDCVAGRGVRGDRFFDHAPDYKGQITFFSREVIEQLRTELALPNARPEAARRNVFVSGVELNTLVGVEFTVQGVRFFGTEECRPCYWMDGALGPGANAWLRGRGGLRARILSDGWLRCPPREISPPPSSPPSGKTFWNQRFAGSGYFYGTEPNAFVAQMADKIPAGPVLCLAEGEGRNAVHLAQRGHAVTAVDQSSIGLAKAARLATERGVTLTTVVADMTDYTITPGAWSGIVATFAHFPPRLRRAVHAQVVAGLRPGGVCILEAYTPAQLAHGTGGPKDAELLMTLAALRDELTGLDFLHACECERDVIEGTGHTGRSAVVQVLARKPA